MPEVTVGEAALEFSFDSNGQICVLILILLVSCEAQRSANHSGLPKMFLKKAHQSDWNGCEDMGGCCHVLFFSEKQLFVVGVQLAIEQDARSFFLLKVASLFCLKI